MSSLPISARAMPARSSPATHPLMIFGSLSRGAAYLLCNTLAIILHGVDDDWSAVRFLAVVFMIQSWLPSALTNAVLGDILLPPPRSIRS